VHKSNGLKDYTLFDKGRPLNTSNRQSKDMYGAHDSISSNNENFYSSIWYRLSNYITKLKTALCSYLLNSEENLEKNFKTLKKALLRQNR